MLFARDAAPEQQQPEFRAATVVVEVSAVITRNGEPVTDIRQDEVVVRDEGVPQELLAFEYVDHRVAASPQEGSGLEAAHDASRGPAGRDYVLLIDDLHISPRLTRATRNIAQKLVDTLAPDDRLAIVNTGPFEVLLQLTTDRDAARRLVPKIRGQKGHSLGVNDQEIKTLIMLRVLKGVADAMAGDASVRRSILLVSEGQALGPAGPQAPGDYHDVWEAYENVVAAAAGANVVVYAVNPIGLVPPVQPTFTGENSQAVAEVSTAARQASSAMLARYHGTLGRISISTGGTLVADSNGLTQGVDDMIRDSRQYYRMAYRQPALAEDATGKRRAISVAVSRPGVEVRARTAYVPR